MIIIQTEPGLRACKKRYLPQKSPLLIMMKLLLLIILFCFQATVLFAEAKDPGLRVFVVETDAESAAASLDRISGDIDLGFSAPDQTFHSLDHYSPGPFGRQQQADKADS